MEPDKTFKIFEMFFDKRCDHTARVVAAEREAKSAASRNGLATRRFGWHSGMKLFWKNDGLSGRRLCIVETVEIAANHWIELMKLETSNTSNLN